EPADACALSDPGRTMSIHRREVRPRYGRIVALATSVTVSVVAALAGMGVLGTSPVQAGSTAKPASYHQARPMTTPDSTAEHQTQQPPTGSTASHNAQSPPQGTATSADAGTATALPADSGAGRRIVFSQSRQRVWLVGDSHGKDDVERTY